MPPSFDGHALHVISARKTQELWVQILKHLCKIFSQAILSVLVGWWEQGDEIEEERLPCGLLSIEGKGKCIVDAWCSFSRIQGGVKLGVFSSGDVGSEGDIFGRKDLVGSTRPERSLDTADILLIQWLGCFDIKGSLVWLSEGCVSMTRHLPF